MRWGRAVVVVVLAVCLHACGFFRSTPTPPPVTNGQQEGIASWYGPGFHGRRTANGEIYDQYELTAAHPSLPLGTRVMVTSLTNGRSVEVRVNDRGPFVGGRVIDLSYASARVIGMIGPGTMPVRIELIGEPVQVASRRPLAPAPPPPARPHPAEPEPRAPSVATARPAPAAEPERRPPPPPAPTVVEPMPAVAEASVAVLVATLSDPGKAEHLRGRLSREFPDAHVSAIDVG